jgi:hypothetical protein
MNIIQELEEEYKIDESLMKPLLDTTDTRSDDCDTTCGLEKTKEIVSKYKEHLANMINIKNKKILSLLDGTTQENCGIVLTIYNHMELLPKQDLDVIIQLIEYIKSERL